MIKGLLTATTILIIFFLPLPLGGNRPAYLSLIQIFIFANAALCLLAWISGLIQYRGGRRPIFFCVVVWVLWLAWVAAQLFDLPTDFMTTWASHRYQLEQSTAGVGIKPENDFPITIDYDVTQLHWVESLAYMCLFFSVVLLAGGSRSTLRTLCWALLLSGLLQAAFGSFMVLSGIEYNLLGPKEHYLGYATGTFVNRNHFAGYLELCASVALGLIIVYSGTGKYGTGLWQRFVDFLRTTGPNLLMIRISLVIFVIGLILSQSRMGNAAALGGLIIAGFLYTLFKRRGNWGRMLLLLIGLVVVDIWLIGDWFGIEQLSARYESTKLESSQRAALLPVLGNMSNTYLPAGSGLGTFEVAYPEFQSAMVRGRPKHAHNDYAQFLIEAGLPGMCLIGLLVVATAIRSMLIIRKRSDPTYNGAALAGLMAMSCIAIHSFADFNLQIPANAATLVIIMALVWSCRLRHGGSRKRQARRVMDAKPAV